MLDGKTKKITSTFVIYILYVYQNLATILETKTGAPSLKIAPLILAGF